MTGSRSPARALLRDIVRLERASLSVVPALRGALGVVVPLVVGAATGQLLAGLTVSIGVLNVAFSDKLGPYRQRAERLLLAAVGAAGSVFVGTLAGESDLLAVCLTAVWGLGGGLLVALGPGLAQVGVTSIVLLLVFSGQPAGPAEAAARAALVLLGGLLQTALAVLAWPARPYGPQRSALATVFRRLAALPRIPSGPGRPPAVTTEMTTAGAMLPEVDQDDPQAQALRSLFERAERIRLELLALDGVRCRLGAEDGEARALGDIDAAMQTAAEVLDWLAEALAAAGPRLSSTGRPPRIQPDAAWLRRLAATNGQAATALRHVEALGGQLRLAVEIAAGGGPTRAEIGAGAATAPALGDRVREALATLRANLTLRSAAGRHALRLASCLVLADALGRGLHLPWSYWVPLTVAVVLRPDFAATFTRGVGRVIGTCLGLVLATGLVAVMLGGVPERVALVGVLAFGVLSLSPANLAVGAVMVSALVVALLSLGGEAPEATIVARGLDTLIGGVLALIAYAAWPTWEREQTPVILAELLEAYRRYFAAVMAGMLEPGRTPAAAVATTRAAARLARTNALASMARLRAEPGRSEAELDRAERLLANSHRFVRSTMALEAALYHQPRPQAPATAALRVFVGDVDSTLQALIRSLRDPSYRPIDPPQPRAAEPVLSGAVGTAASRHPVLANEAGQLADSLARMARLVDHRD